VKEGIVINVIALLLVNPEFYSPAINAEERFLSIKIYSF
jgi:hypothetical protein